MATIEGRNPVIEAIKNDREIDKIMIANSAKEGSIKKIIGMAKEKNIVIQYVDKHKLDEVSTIHSHQGVIAQASAGAVEYVPVCKVTNIVNTIKKLKGEGLWIAAADMDGQTFYEQNLTGALGLVIGSEGFGISRLVKQNCDFTVKMPMIGNVTSLNASVAAGILLYEIFKQRSGNK